MSNLQRNLIAPEQFRMTRLQIYNWGTFSDLHDISIAHEGFLFVGNSGSGKSTLLDAFSALLIPPRWLDFNAAARESEPGSRDRNLMSYVRGAWSEQEDVESGEIKTRYLRRDTTWSALAATFSSPSRAVTLIRLFWVRGPSTANEDVKYSFLILEKPFELRTLENFGTSNFDIAKLKQTFPDVFIRSEFSQYCERFCRLLGIENESALRLLHRTQSAKNLGDLNNFLRTFMLEPPKTFEVAKHLVEEFTELNAAHQEVLTARSQIAMLLPARDLYQQRETALREKTALNRLRDFLDAYRNRRRADLLRHEIADVEGLLGGYQNEVSRCTSDALNERTNLHELEQQHREAGGDNIERWEAEKLASELQITDRLRKRALVSTACDKLGWPDPDDPIVYGNLLRDARQECEGYDNAAEASRHRSHEIFAKEQELTRQFADARREVEVLERNTSNIPEHMIRLRASISAATGVNEGSLPFVGELIEVKDSESAWKGAAERALHGFALSMLASEKDHSEILPYINRTRLAVSLPGDRLRGQRLITYKTHPVAFASQKLAAPLSLFHKLEIKDSPHSAWLRLELLQRFDYLCVNSATELRNADKAMTREGLIKHGRSMHEKDDRQPIDDRRNWVLGFDSKEKLALYVKEAQRLGAEIARIQEEARQIKSAEALRFTRFNLSQNIINTTWDEIDTRSLSERVASLADMIREAREGNINLRRLAEQIVAQKKRYESAEKALVDARTDLRDAERLLAERRAQLRSLTLSDVPRDTIDALDARYAAIRTTINLNNIDTTHSTAQNRLSHEIEDMGQRVSAFEKEVEKVFADFLHTWRLEEGGLQAKMASADDFLAKLARLELDNLPAYEERFFNLLQRQSHQHLVALSTYLRDGRKEIRDRMDYVNDSLAVVPFNKTPEQTTYLRIHMTDKQSEDVREFKQDISHVLDNSISANGTVDREVAEERFKILSGKIVARLASQELEDRRWRENVLDVRRHVEFIGREVDEEGQDVEIYRSGSGKSGGQRQKLATTCLAAALCYQLGANQDGTPTYAPVILDEAFGKEDSDFTAISLAIFKNFGFQVLIATPFQKVMTIEPFVGGACLVDITDRQTSGVLNILYDTAEKKLKFPENRALAYENAQ